jgi:hypothetical protein
MDKKTGFLAIALCAFFYIMASNTQTLAAQGFSAAVGGVSNMNAVSGFAVGPYANGFYAINDLFMIGMQVGGTFSSSVNTFEIEALFRLTFDFNLGFNFDPFLQVGGGLSLMTLHIVEPGIDKFVDAPQPLIDVTAGGRFGVFGSFYLEAGVKMGWPFLLGFQLMIGTSIPPYLDFGSGRAANDAPATNVGGDTGAGGSANSQGGETYETVN